MAVSSPVGVMLRWVGVKVEMFGISRRSWRPTFISSALGAAGVGTAATGIGLAATPFLELGAAGGQVELRSVQRALTMA